MRPGPDSSSSASGQDVDISIVIPVYNGENYLAGCLESVAAAVDVLDEAQRRRIEIVVCDNHSTDGSRAIAEGVQIGCPSRVVSPHQHETNRTRNWAYGLGEARGRWLMMLHHDDLMAPEGLAAQLSHSSQPGIDTVVMISGRHRTFDDPAAPGPPRPIVQPEGILSGRLLQERVLAYHCPFMPFVLFRRATYDKVGGLDPRWELVQDWELWMRLLGAGDVLFHEQQVGWWRQHPTSARYRGQNAREHVELARDLNQSIPTISAKTQAKVCAMALDRAALQLGEIDDPDADWLDQEALPNPSIARTRHKRAVRRIGAELTVLRLIGAARHRAGMVVRAGRTRGS